LDFAIIPLCSFIRWAFISGTTKGTSSCILYALVLSTHTAPAFTALGRNSRLLDAPALDKTMSHLQKNVPEHLDRYDLPPNFNFLPLERSDASSLRLFIGNFSGRVIQKTGPHSPVAPMTATLYFFPSITPCFHRSLFLPAGRQASFVFVSSLQIFYYKAPTSWSSIPSYCRELFNWVLVILYRILHGLSRF